MFIVLFSLLAPIVLLLGVWGIPIVLGILSIPIYYLYYVLYKKDYTDDEYKIKEEKEEEKENDDKNNLQSEVMIIYKKQIDDLIISYETKEKIARETIEKHFTPPQLTYDRLIGIINDCSEIFYGQAELTYNIVNIATKNTPKINEELKKRLSTLKLLIEKVDDLTMELVINVNNHGVDNYVNKSKEVLSDMELAISDIKEYNY
ncbi:MAG: hypothetical protein LBT66_05410 [Methanobrevibacter sp.]|nr:hypothetical protein [Candidatus Methanovirga meridionalis]